EATAPALFGHAPAELADRTFADELDRLASLLRGGGVHLVGYSLGARLALALLARHPRLFRRATLIGAHPGLPARQRAARAPAHGGGAALTDLAPPPFAHAWEAHPLFPPQRRLSAPALARQRRQRLAHSPSGLARALRRLGLAAMPPVDLAAVAAPVHLVAG